MIKALREIWNLFITFWLPTAMLCTIGVGLYSYSTTVRDSATEIAEMLEDMAIVCEDAGGEFAIVYNTEILYAYGECDYNLDDKLELLPYIPLGKEYDDSL